MKLIRYASVLALVFASAATVSAQGTTPIGTNAPVVNVTAPVPAAYEGGTGGRFRVMRDVATTNALTVFFNLGGTAINGADYAAITNNYVTIPPNEMGAPVLVDAIDDKLVEGNETVVLHLVSSPLMSPLAQYLIGTQAEAVVTIVDNDRTPTNHPPAVSIVQPTNNAVFVAPANITIFAAPRDDDGTVVTVEFFAGTNSLGSVTPNLASGSPVNPWNLTWSNVPPGYYSLRALATDNAGATGLSSPVNITVRAPENLRAVVQVIATDPEAAEGGSNSSAGAVGNPGRFLVIRTGDTNPALTINYSLSGSASNGVDYDALPGTLALAAGEARGEIVVNPIDDSIVEPTESVVLTIQPPVCTAIFPPAPECYLVGASNRAVVFIRDNEVLPTNLPPVVTVSAIDSLAVEGPLTNVLPSTVLYTNRVDGTNIIICTNWTAIRTNAMETNTAMFRVTRNTTNGDLVVNYVMLGTASNGVDYVQLPGTVTLRAGERSARVMVVPMEDALQEGIETVVLRLVPPPNSDPTATTTSNPPPYFIGWPGQAGAVIIDNDVPWPSTSALQGALFNLNAPRTNGFIYRLECSTNLVDWVPVYTNVVTDGSVRFVDPESQTVPNRFYRVVPAPALPLE